MNAEHRPTWTAHGREISYFQNGYEYPIATVAYTMDKEEQERTAKFIARACNSHQELLQAVKEARDYLGQIKATDADGDEVLLHGKLAGTLERAEAKGGE